MAGVTTSFTSMVTSIVYEAATSRTTIFPTTVTITVPPVQATPVAAIQQGVAASGQAGFTAADQSNTTTPHTGSTALNQANPPTSSPASSLNGISSSSSMINSPRTISTSASLPASETTGASTPTTPAVTRQRKSGYSDGAVAGFAIGFFILGLLLAAALFFALRRRRIARQRPSRVGYNDKDSQAGAALPLFAKKSAGVSVDEYLPQPKDDKTIIGDFSKLKSRIDNHVQTYYGNTGANPEAAAQVLSHAVGSQSPIPVGNLPALLADDRTRLPLLRAALSSIIMSRIGGDAARNPGNSLLPPDMATTYSNMSRSTNANTAAAALFGKWRQITTSTSGDAYSKEQLDANDPRLTNIHKAMQAADSFLSYYAEPRDQRNRLRNLEEIIKRAARLDFLLFSQPADFRFDWGGSGQNFVVFPGLLQVSDEAGRALPSPRVLIQAESTS